MFRTISKVLLYVSFFSVLVVITGTFFPFIGGKYYFFRVATEFSLLALIFWWAFEARPHELERQLRQLVREPVVIAVSVFVLAFLLASVFAYDPHAAFWSNYERGEGGFQMIHYYIFFILLLLHFKKEEEWRRVFIVLLFAATAMILYGVLGYIDLACVQRHQRAHYSNPQLGCPGFQFITAYSGGNAPTGFWNMLVDGRFQGSLGNPAYVAPHLFFAIFYALWLWTDKRKKEWWGHALYASTIVFFLLFFMFSQTRGAFLGLIAAVLVFLLYIAFQNRRLRSWALSALVVLSLVGFGLVHYQNSVFIQQLPVNRLFNFGVADSLQTRLWTWGSAWKGFKERPLLGWGPENFSTVFDKYFDPRHFKTTQASETWFDRAHSVFFDYLTETGILGFASYIAIFVFFYLQFFKKSHREHKSNSFHEQSSVHKALLFALPIGYLVQGLVLFDVLPIYINLFIFMAFSAILFQHNTPLMHHERHT